MVHSSFRRARACALLLILAAGCSTPPKYRITSDIHSLGDLGEPAGLAVESELSDLEQVEVLGKVWVFKWATTTFGSVSDEYLLDHLAAPAAALGAERVIGAQISSLCTFEDWVPGLGNHIGEGHDVSKWASGLAVRDARPDSPLLPCPWIVALPASPSAEPGSEFDIQSRRAIQSVLEQRGYYVRMVDQNPLVRSDDPAGSENGGLAGTSFPRSGAVFYLHLIDYDGEVKLRGDLISVPSGEVLWTNEYWPRRVSVSQGGGERGATISAFGAQGITGGGSVDSLYEHLYELLRPLPMLARNVP